MPSAAERPGWLYAAVAGCVLGLDLVTKTAAEATLHHSRVLPVLGDWLQLRLVYNPGAAFNLDLGPWSRWIFLLVAIAAVALLTRFAWTTSARDRLRLVALGLVAGGASGNLVDRVRSPHGVVDFLDIGFGALRWPTFNVADMAVGLGAITLAISIWIEDARRSRAETSSTA